MKMTYDGENGLIQCDSVRNLLIDVAMIDVDAIPRLLHPAYSISIFDTPRVLVGGYKTNVSGNISLAPHISPIVTDGEVSVDEFTGARSGPWFCLNSWFRLDAPLEI